jgi:cytochrome c-type biogenesis protein CcmH
LAGLLERRALYRLNGMAARLTGLLIALCAAALIAAPAAAAACPQTSLADLEDEVMCTVCGTTLGLATEAPQAQRQRAFLVSRIERCQSKDEIKAALAAEFGPEVLATPGSEGFGLAAYAVPVIAVLAGLFAVALTAVRWRRRRRATAGGPRAPELAGARAARLEADLERYDP